MKCNYCNTELKQGAKFCPNCGREVSEFDVCISCGQQIKVGAKFCPHCGANQKETIKPSQQEDEITNNPIIDISEQNEKACDVVNAVPEQHEESPDLTAREGVGNTLPSNEQDVGSKKWIWVIAAVLLLGLIGGGYYFVSQNRASSSGLAEAVDTDSIEADEPADQESIENDPVAVEAAEARQAMADGCLELEIEEKTAFIKEMYEDFFENRNFNSENADNLRKYLSDKVMKRIYLEDPYGEDEKYYVVDCFRDGSLSVERPDYGDKVIKREIHTEDGEWFEVKNIWDVIDTPVIVRLKIDYDDDGMKVMDFR